MTFPPLTVGSVLALIVLILSVLLALSVVPFTAVTVGALIAVLALARLV